MLFGMWPHFYTFEHVGYEIEGYLLNFDNRTLVLFLSNNSYRNKPHVDERKVYTTEVVFPNSNAI